jgi:hypothetical protein
LTAEQLTTSNHRFFEFEDDCVFRPQETRLIVSRNTNPIPQVIYKHHHTRPTNKLYYTGLYVKNTGHKTIKIKKNTLLTTLVRRAGIMPALTVVTAKDLLRAEIDTTAFINAYLSC